MNPRYLKSVFAVTAFSALVLALPASALDQADSPSEDSELPPEEAIEEIVVYGERNIVLLRADVRIAADSFYELYNSLNSNDEYNIECRREFNIIRHRNERVCMTRFARKTQARDVQEMISSGFGWTENKPTYVRVKQKEELVRQEIARLLTENPELREVFSEYATAWRDLNAEMRRRSGKSDK
jgi:hypothetical protein